MKKKLCPREFRSLTYADKAMIQYLSHQGQTLEYISEVLDIDMDLLAAEYNQYNHHGKYYAKWGLGASEELVRRQTYEKSGEKILKR